MTDDLVQAFDAQSHGTPPGVRDRRGRNGTADLPPLMRIVLAVAGGALVLQGLRRRSLVGSAMTWTGSTLAWWGVTGRSPVPAAGRRLAEVGARPPS